MWAVSRSKIRNGRHLIHKLENGCIHSSIHTQIVHWSKINDEQQNVETCRLLSFRPHRISSMHGLTVNDTTSCQSAFNHLRNGKALVYTGPGASYHNARQLLQALKRRHSKQNKNAIIDFERKDHDVREQWLMQRQILQEQSELVNRLLIRVSLYNKRPKDIFDLKRAPSNADEVLVYAFQNDEDIGIGSVQYHESEQSYVLLSLNDFLAMTGSFEWNRKGVYINALNDYIYPHYGAFPPTRQDYITLLDHIRADMSHQKYIRLLEVGIGTGVLSIILLQQNKVHYVVGTDINPYALNCSRVNFRRFSLDDRVELIHADLFPNTKIRSEMASDKYDVVLFNPPWIPGVQATSALDQAVYDTLDQSVLRRFLSQVQYHVESNNGRVYLFMSNLGILLGLFDEQDIYNMFDEGNLDVVEVHKTIPKVEIEDLRSPKKAKKTKQITMSSIESARANEIISLYHLRFKQAKTN